MAKVDAATTPVRIGLIGKYVQLPDAYLSVVESLKHAGFHHGAKVEIDWIQAEDVEGLLAAGRLRRARRDRDPRRLRVARVRGQDRRRPLRPRGARAVPRSVPRAAGDDGRVRPQRARARRRQLDGVRPDDEAPGDRPDARPARHHRQGRHDAARRLLRRARARARKVAEAYGEPVVSERHRHRYEFNSNYRARFEAAGFVCSGTSPDRRLVEFIELRRPSVLGRHAGPPGVQEPARSAAPAVPRADRRRTRRDVTPPGLRRMLARPASQPCTGVERRRPDA